MEKEPLERQEYGNQYTGQDKVGMAPAQPGYGEFGEHTVGEAEAGPDLPQPGG